MARQDLHRARLGGNDDGFILVAVMVIMLLLVVLGRSSMMTSRIEVQIAGNDKFHKMAFYGADGSTEMATKLLEENIKCGQGFYPSNPATTATIGNILVTDKDFWTQESAPVGTYPSDTQLDVRYPATGTPYSNITAWGVTQGGVGSGFQMVAGYEGKGKGSATGGSSILYQIDTQHLGDSNSEVKIRLRWRHHIASPTPPCNYD